MRVELASGVDVGSLDAACAGASVAKLRKEVAEALKVNAGGVELSVDGTLLEDIGEVPASEGAIMVVLSNPEWVDDGSERLQNPSGGEFTLGGEPMKGDGKFNFRCDVPLSQGVDYFEVEILEAAGAWVGVTTLANFGQSYKMKGLFFGGPGNLSDGGGLKRSRYGEEVKTGDVIGVAVDMSVDDKISVTFWQGDTCLGPAFECAREPGTVFYPAVSTRHTGERFKINFRRKARMYPVKAQLHAAEGTWELRTVVQGTNQMDTTQQPGQGKGYGKGGGGPPVPVLTMAGLQRPADPSKDPSTFKFNMRIMNVLNTVVTVTPNNGNDTVAVAPAMMTMMMGSDLENAVLAVLAKVNSWAVVPDTSLHLIGPDERLEFVRDTTPPPGPVTDVPFLK